MKTALDPRHLRRRKIVQELFAWDAQSKIPGAKLKTKSLDEKTTQTIDHLDKIDKIITDAAPEWGTDKVNKIDLAILRLATFELIFERTEPEKAIIDEAIELSKEFGSDSSSSFINGALGKILTSKPFLHHLISEKLGAEENQLTPQTRLREDLNASDLEIADLVTALEAKTGIPFDKNTSQLTTIEDLENVIDDQL